MDFETLIPPEKPQRCIIWLHGLGADGHDFVPVAKVLQSVEGLPPTQYVFPHAPIRPITLNQGYPMRAWYDINELSETAREDEAGVLESEILIHDLIAQAKSEGMAANQIFLAGFSQGGAMALHTGLRHPERLGGIIALSCYLPIKHTFDPAQHNGNRNTPIFLAHGTQDAIVPCAWGKATCEYLEGQGYPVAWHDYPMDHSVCDSEVADLAKWLYDSHPNFVGV